MKNVAVLYLRSSKDRSDVSIDAQRRQLRTLATERGLTVLKEFADAVESGKDDQRPGFQELIKGLKDKNRQWSMILMLDTSRLSRNIYIAEVFKHECRKRDVKIVYANLPEANPMIDLVVVQIMQAFDQMHSMMSREKGLAGMAENVKQGFRAGGKAPWGYKLVQHATGAIRDGQPVTKSKLEPALEAETVKTYLKMRAAGRSRSSIIAQLKIDKPESSLVGLEWNALTYAGHTVWNVHNEQTESGSYKGGEKRKPRSEWLIKKNTHPALITDDEAERLIAKLENKKAVRSTRSRGDDYLLSGILLTPSGKSWHGNAGYYRAGTKNISAPYVEEEFLSQITEDLRGDSFIKAILEAARSFQNQTDDAAELEGIEKRLGEIKRSTDKLTDLLDQTTAPEALLRKIEGLEEERTSLLRQYEELSAARRTAKAMSEINEDDARAFVNEISHAAATLDRGMLKEWLKGLIDRIELDPATNSGQIIYRLAVSGVMLASPRGFEPRYSP